MGKKLFSLCMALALCLSLLPATALAADGDTVYVGGVALTYNGTDIYATTDPSGKVITEGATADDYNIKWDGSTLTLDGAKIKGGTSSESLYATVGIYAFSNSGDVSLNIALKGVNEIFESSNGIWVYSSSDNAGAVTLTIEGEGSLNASGSSSGILVQSNSGDATLTIQNAEVTATSTNVDGVQVRSGAQKSASLTVDGGSLTATGMSEYGAGIQYTFGSSSSGSGKPSLTVSGNAMVKASGGEGGISDNSSTDIQIGEGQNSSGGIVFNGSTGTVYGSVTLQDDLEIKSGETLTIGNGASLTVQSGKTLTNNGTVTTTGSGTLTNSGTINNSGTLPDSIEGSQPPKIITTSLFNGEVDKNYSQALVSDNNPTKWSITSGSLPGGLTLDGSTSLISGTPTAAGTYSFTVTATNTGGSDSEQLSITINPAAAVPVESVSLDKTTLGLTEGETARLTATVEPSNATNKSVTWSSDNESVATVDTSGNVTAVSAGTATITVTTDDGGKTDTCTVTVSRYSSGGGSSSSSTSLSDRAIDDIQDARPGDTVEITLRPGRTTLEREVFEELAGQDITLEIDAGDGVLWTVNGLDIPEDTRLHDLDLDVDLGDSGIPATVLNAVTGEIGTVQLSLAHDGEFGFTMTLSAPLGRDNADYWANLYWYNERTEELEFQQAARIANDGTAEFALDHASDYAIVIDDRSHEPVDLPFNDVPEGYWAYDAIQYVYGEGLMAGTSGSTFSPEGTTTRGQIVTILWRLSGSPVVNYLMDFDDVDPAAYYAEAIRWASAEGVAGGYGGGVFGPDDPITREQLAVMLHRYARYMGYDVSVGEDTNILSYADAFTVSEYAVSALQWACGAGIISGTGDGSTLTPQGEATRAQAATVLMRFCEEFQ